MKSRSVVFAGFSITPYFRDFLNRLQKESGCTISVIKPAGKDRNLGDGVKVDEYGAKFVIAETPDVFRGATYLFGCKMLSIAPAFHTLDGLATFLSQVNADIIVVNVNYHDAFYLDTALRDIVKSLQAKIVFHSIPFQIPDLNEIKSHFQVPATLPLASLPLPMSWLFRLLMIDRLVILPIRRFFSAWLIRNICAIYRMADAFAVYHEGGKDLYGSYGVEASRIHVVRNSPNTEALIQASEGRKKTDDGCSLIHVGRLVAWKRVDLLIRALHRLRSGSFPTATLTIVGYGPEEENLRTQVAELGLKDAVNFTGGVYEPDDLAELFAKASIYVLAGMGGLSINEAMCFQMPIVCCRGDGTEKFLVRDGENGFYFREGDLDDLVRVLTELLASGSLREKFGRKSLQIIQREINTHIHVQNYIRLFNTLLASA